LVASDEERVDVRDKNLNLVAREEEKVKVMKKKPEIDLVSSYEERVKVNGQEA